MAVLNASTKPCSANRLMSDRIRRCVSIANASSNSVAAKRLMSWLDRGKDDISGFQQEVRQHAECREQERGSEKLRSAENPHFGGERFQQCQSRACQKQFCRQCRQRDGQPHPITRL